MGGKPLELTGQTFGRLTVLSKIGRIKGNAVYWECRCECGALVNVRASSLTTGHTKSCGCLNKEIITKHGQCCGGEDSRLYVIWRAMHNRCYREKDISYPNYGARGVTVCKEWRDDFFAFESWAKAAGFTPGLHIDRVDVNAEYGPDNCRWVTQHENNQNRRTTKLDRVKVKAIRLAHQAKITTVKEIADFFGVCVSTVNYTLKGKRWSNI
jgi:hypothetical protein